MAWSYTDPETDPKDEIRYLVGDTDEENPLVTDEEINFVLGIRPKVAGKINYQAAAEVCATIAAKFGRKIRFGVGPISRSEELMFDHYTALSEKLRGLAATDGLAPGSIDAMPVLGGGGRKTLGSQWGSTENYPR